jgi:hypothetical protein
VRAIKLKKYWDKRGIQNWGNKKPLAGSREHGNETLVSITAGIFLLHERLSAFQGLQLTCTI